tara:strand:+ start:5411 stop:5689 length:279 start_codon:yes stop_codon:yes gene_type:complete
MATKKNIYLLLSAAALVIVMSLVIQPASKCGQCGQDILIMDHETKEVSVYREPLMAYLFAAHSNFLHMTCVDDYLRDHPIERGEEGHIIPKI